MKKYGLIGAALLFSLSLSSCSSMMRLKEFDINGEIVNRKYFDAYLKDYSEFYKDETSEIKNKWYSLNYKESNFVEEDEYISETEETIKGSLYCSKFEFENKIKLNIKIKETMEGIDPSTSKEVDTEITHNYDIVYLKGVTYVKHTTKEEIETGHSETIDYFRKTSYSFNEVLRNYVGISIDGIVSNLADIALDPTVNLEGYNLYSLDDGLAYSYEDYNDYNDYISKLSFETMNDSYQPKKIKKYNYLKGRYYTDSKDVYRENESLLVIKTKLFGRVSKPSNLSKY